MTEVIGFAIVSLIGDDGKPTVDLDPIYTGESEGRKVGAKYYHFSDKSDTEREVIYVMDIDPLFGPIYDLVRAFGLDGDTQGLTYDVITEHLNPALRAVARFAGAKKKKKK